MLQAYIDDSKRSDGDRRLYLAGYVNTVDRWLAFNEDWREALSEGKSIRYFKMRECQSCRGEFKGWGRLDREIKRFSLANVIRKHDPWSIHVSVSTRSIERLYQNCVPFGFQDPYMMLFIAMAIQIAQIQNFRADKSTVDLIFDQQSQIERSVAALYQGLKEMQSDDLRARMGGMPLFRSDLEVLPLQAADMLAWHVRRETRDGEFRPRSREMELLISNGKHYYVHVDDRSLSRMGDGMARLEGTELLKGKKMWTKVIEQIESLNADRRGRV